MSTLGISTPNRPRRRKMGILLKSMPASFFAIAASGPMPNFGYFPSQASCHYYEGCSPGGVRSGCGLRYSQA
jgi:hypothetical protein